MPVFEDIHVLGQLFEKHGDDWDSIFSEYQKERKPNADAIAELSYRNFVEMSSKTADPKFLLQKKIENGLPKSIQINGFRSTVGSPFQKGPMRRPWPLVTCRKIL